MKRSAPRSSPAASVRPDSLPWSATAFVLALVAVAAVVSARHYAPFLADDALISLRYARRLLDGHGLTWTDGPRVEGYSNLLWILLVAGPGALGAELVTVARTLGVACAAATAVLTATSELRARPGSLVAALVAGAFVSTSGSLAVWAAAGLETPLVGLLLAWALLAARPLVTGVALAARDARAASVPLALLALARPDAPLFAVAFAAGVLAVRGARRDVLAACAWLVGPALAAVGAQEVFRLAYYHSPVPNPARVKLALTPHRLEAGLGHLRMALAHGWPFALAAVAGAIDGLRRPERRGLTVLAGVTALAWLAYVVFIGGDFFPGYRHLLPAVVLAAPLAAGLARLAAPMRVRLPAAAATLALLAAFAVLQRADDENERANRETWVWQGEATALQLRREFGAARPLMAVVSAGCFPYWSGLPSLDMLGLNDAWIAAHPPAEVGSGWVGHELGDPAYVMERRPDIVQFSGIRRSFRTGWFRVERELAAREDFRRHYTLVTFEASDPRAAVQPLWVRIDSPRIGVVREPGRVAVPAWMFTLNPAVTATSDASGRLGLVVTAERPAAFGRLQLARGRWHARLDPPAPGLVLGLRPAGADIPFGRIAPAGFVVDPQQSEWDLVLSAEPGVSAHVRSVTLEREAVAR